MTVSGENSLALDMRQTAVRGGAVRGAADQPAGGCAQRAARRSTVGKGAKPPTWQTGVWWDAESRSDLFAFTLDKSVGSFSPTTRYRDYAISRELIHWESQSATSVDGETGRRYIASGREGTNVVLFGRLRSDDRAFWCLSTARYRSHEGDRPIAFVWELDHPLPADLYTAFAAAVA